MTIERPGTRTNMRGYTGYTIRQITIGDAQQGGGIRTKSFAMEQRAAAPLPIESGEVTLALTVNGMLH